MKTETQLITFDELMDHRGRPLNDEHCEAFMKERYQVALQIALVAENDMTEEGRFSFPIIVGADFSLVRLRLWSLEFEAWRDGLSARDRRGFNTAQFYL